MPGFRNGKIDQNTWMRAIELQFGNRSRSVPVMAALDCEIQDERSGNDRRAECGKPRLLLERNPLGAGTQAGWNWSGRKHQAGEFSQSICQVLEKPGKQTQRDEDDSHPYAVYELGRT